MEETNKKWIYINALVYFDGNKKDLNRLKKAMIIEHVVPNYNKLNYSELASKIPVISKEKIYKLLGYDSEKSKFNKNDKYTDNELLNFGVNARKVLDTLGFIDFREVFVNKTVNSIMPEFKDDRLLVSMMCNDYLPVEYFDIMAAKYGVTMRAVEKTAGTGLSIFYNEDFYDEESPYFNHEDPPSTRIVRAENGTKSILNNPEFRKNAVELGIHKPSYHVVVALAYGKTDLAKSIVEQYSVTKKDLEEPVAIMHTLLNNSKDFNPGYYRSSPFVDFIEKRPKNISKMDFMTEFKKLGKPDVDLDVAVTPVAAKSKKPKMK